MDENQAYKNQIRALEEEIVLLKGRANFWYWQGDGLDDIDSLACPVLIPAEPLRKLIEAARAMPRRTPEAGAASTLHTFELPAAAIWKLDQALSDLGL